MMAPHSKEKEQLKENPLVGVVEALEQGLDVLLQTENDLYGLGILDSRLDTDLGHVLRGLGIDGGDDGGDRRLLAHLTRWRVGHVRSQEHHLKNSRLLFKA